MRNKIKIKYITNARIPTEKAHGYQICKMCEEFARAETDVELVVPTRRNNTDKNAFEFYSLEKNFTVSYINTFDPFQYDFLSGKLGFYIQSFCYFIKLLFYPVHKDETVFTRDAWIAWLYSMKGSKVVYEAHTWPNSKNALYKLFIKNINLLVCNSKGTEKAHNDFGLLMRSIVSPNGVDVGQYVIDKDKDELRSEMGLPRNEKIVLYVGHLYEWKGAHILLRAAEQMGNKIKIVFVGGTNNDVAKFRTMAGEKGLSNVYVLGHKDKNDIPKYLKSADVLVLPNAPVSEESIKYTSPIKMFEYMASGIPIVASDLPSIREVLNDNNSVLVKAGDAYAITKGIQKIVADDTLAEEISNQAFQDVQRYSWKNRAEKIINEIYKL